MYNTSHTITLYVKVTNVLLLCMYYKCIIPVNCFIFPFLFYFRAVCKWQVHAFMPGYPGCIVKLLPRVFDVFR